MSDFLFWYLTIGAGIVSLGIWLHSLAWENTYKESAVDGMWLWIAGLVFWPLGLDVLLMHKGYDSTDGL